MKKLIGLAAVASVIFLGGMGVASARDSSQAAANANSRWRCAGMSGQSGGGQGCRRCPKGGNAGMNAGQGKMGGGNGRCPAGVAAAPSSGQ
ncbi:MAG: hypothetical protein P4L43_02985 [Syntrophobacteraceae bacterium]|nr:hypothetical protein [Syntrophobacteraceae bacterium]